MIQFILGVIFGIVVATAGFGNFASFADRQLDTAKQVIKENVK